MAWIDWLIVFAMLAAVVSGLAQGFLRSVCSLGGLFFGLLMAAWNYPSAARVLLPLVRFETLANVIGFVLIVLAVAAVANLTGWLLNRTAHTVGLGCLDRLLGGLFGFFQGWMVITILILLVAAFSPGAEWIHRGQLPRLFFGSAHFGAHLSPAELAAKIRSGLELLESQRPSWMHANPGS